uniref:Uncharacterized protein n=1 Tax=Ciona savignyi TaxID=51511 RepID=H2ZAX2_CIOSA
YQEKCREEIREIMEDRKNVQFFDVAEMTYLTMCMKESMRLYAPVPFIGRKIKNKINVHRPNGASDVTLDADVTVIPHLFTLHRNPEIWDEPEVFDPERFNVKNSAKMHPYAFVPFSAGPRVCMGQNFAMIEMKLIVSKLLLNFEFWVDGETPEP